MKWMRMEKNEIKKMNDQTTIEAPRDHFHTIIDCNWDIKAKAFYGQSKNTYYNWTINHYHPFLSFAYQTDTKHNTQHFVTGKHTSI